MTFEEFFKKKKINMALLNLAEPELFAEFESHYQLMGEKSFDHTKKYWFNSLRRKYHLPDEPKVEKVIIENKIAEQTITEAIIEQVEIPVAKLGFKPKLKKGIAKVPDESITSTAAETGAPAEGNATPKLGFKPKFKSATSPVESANVIPDEKGEQEIKQEAAAPKLGFKPKFKSAATPVENTPQTPGEKTEPEAGTEVAVPKLEFKPKFKSLPPKPTEEIVSDPETKAAEHIDSAQEAKPAYIPKFQARNIKPKTGDTE